MLARLFKHKHNELIEAINILHDNQVALKEEHNNLNLAHVKLARRVDQLSGIEVAAFNDPQDDDVRKLRDEVRELSRLVRKVVPVEER